MTRLPERTPRPPAGPRVREPGHRWRVVLVVAVAVQLISLYSPEMPSGLQIPGLQIPGLDKVVHLSIFAVPVLAALMAGISAPLVLGILAVHAPLSELIQHFALTQRNGDVLDMMADLAGVAVGWLAYVVWSHRQP